MSKSRISFSLAVLFFAFGFYYSARAQGVLAEGTLRVFYGYKPPFSIQFEGDIATQIAKDIGLNENSGKRGDWYCDLQASPKVCGFTVNYIENAEKLEAALKASGDYFDVEGVLGKFENEFSAPAKAVNRGGKLIYFSAGAEVGRHGTELLSHFGFLSIIEGDDKLAVSRFLSCFNTKRVKACLVSTSKDGKLKPAVD